VGDFLRDERNNDDCCDRNDDITERETQPLVLNVFMEEHSCSSTQFHQAHGSWFDVFHRQERSRSFAMRLLRCTFPAASYDFINQIGATNSIPWSIQLESGSGMTRVGYPDLAT